LPELRKSLGDWDEKTQQHKALLETIAAIESATTAPDLRHLKAVAEPKVVNTPADTPLSIALAGRSPREDAVTIEIIKGPDHGTLSGNTPNPTYTPNSGYTGPDQFTIRTKDKLTTSEPATIGIIVGPAGTGLKAEYFSDSELKKPAFTRSDARVDFDWPQESPHESIDRSNFGVKWTGHILIPETGTYTFSVRSGEKLVLYIDSMKVIDHRGFQPPGWVDGTPVTLKQGQRLEIGLAYANTSGPAAARLKWLGPSVAGTSGGIITQANL
jgi:hypothetical protein